MDLIECFEKRRSVRSFSDEDVPEELIEKTLMVANLAPSAGNLQARDFIVVRDDGTRRNLMAAAHNQSFVSKAPVVVVCCANHDRIIEYGPRGRNLYCLQDVAASVENMLLFVAAQGYGACWVGAFDEKEVSDILGIPEHVRPVTMVAIGKPKKESTKPPRVKTDGLIHYEKWGKGSR